MVVRLRSIERLSPEEYRLALDVVDPGRSPWDYGDCLVQIDLIDTPHRHESVPRGILPPALELYRLSPDTPPKLVEARLLWEIGEAVYQYVGRLFEAGILCPFAVPSRSEAPERSA